MYDPTKPQIKCPHCEDQHLKVEDRNGKFLGYAPEPEGDVDGPHFPTVIYPEQIVYCDDCGEVTAVEAFDFIWGVA